MAEEFVYHYTSSVNAKCIFLSGEIKQSTRAGGDAVHGDGVYLTTLEPSLGRDTVTANNWGGAAGAQKGKIECYFEILLPSVKLRRAKERRDIQIFSGNLVLSRYKWSLKTFDGGLVATQHYMVSSQGQAAVAWSRTMGQYTLCQNVVSQDDTPAYKHDENNYYIFRGKNGNWCVGETIGHNRCSFTQRSENSLSPNKTKPWLYADVAGKWQEDETLKVFPCY